MSAFRLLALLLVCLSCSPARANEAQGIAETIERIKPSIVVVGVYNKLASPPLSDAGHRLRGREWQSGGNQCPCLT